MAEKRKSLTLVDRVKVIEYAEANPRVGTRKIAEVFKCGRTQVQGILNSKEAIMTSFQANAPTSRNRNRGARYEDVDAAVYEWYRLARERLVYTGVGGNTVPP